MGYLPDYTSRAFICEHKIVMVEYITPDHWDV